MSTIAIKPLSIESILFYFLLSLQKRYRTIRVYGLKNLCAIVFPTNPVYPNTSVAKKTKEMRNTTPVFPKVKKVSFN